MFNLDPKVLVRRTRASLSVALVALLLSVPAAAQTVFFHGKSDSSVDLATSKVTLMAEEIENRSNGKSGNVMLELWAAPPGNDGCGQYTGWRVATAQVGQMAPGTTVRNFVGTVDANNLPEAAGAYPLGLWVQQRQGDVIYWMNCVNPGGALNVVPKSSCFSQLTLSSSAVNVSGNGGSGNISVTVPSGCQWKAGSNASWLTATPANATGPGAVTYTAEANDYGVARTGYIVVGGKQFSVSQPAKATATVVEFYNPDLNHYFITADPNEQTFVDSGAVGRWQRTGNTFKAGGPNQVCRFYGNSATNPATGAPYGPNSHFYTANAEECAFLKSLFNPTASSWKFEGNDFATTPASNGACTSGLLPVYRAYNNGFAHGVDSNHRITSNLAAYQQTVAAGWSAEGVVLCAPQ